MTEFYTSFGRHFDKIQVRGFRDGVRFERQIKYTPYHFTENPEGEYRNVFEKPVKKRTFATISDARKFIDNSSETVYGSNLYDYTYINDTYQGEIKFDPTHIRVGNIDIETDSENGFGSILLADKAIISVSIKVFGEDSIYVLGLKDYTSTYDHGKVQVKYMKCDSEVQLLQMLIKVWRKLDFDIITGWNIEAYDIPYIIRRITNILGEEEAKKLSPWGTITTRTAVMFNKETTFYVIAGISTIDYMDAYKKFTFGNEESYKLNFILTKVIGRGKLDYSEYGTLANLYKMNFNKFIDYNIIDVTGVEELDNRMKFMGQIFSIAYYAKVNFNDTFTTVRIWDVMIHNYLLERGYVVPPSTSKEKTEQNLGGYVKEPPVGRYGYTVSFDFTSLYPKIAIMYNISPETFVTQINDLRDKYTAVDMILDGYYKEYVPKIKSNNFTVTGKGTVFRRDKQGFIPAIMALLFDMRKAYKKKMLAAQTILETTPEGTPEYSQADFDAVEYNNKQMAIKILLNSGYGALANQYFRWYSNDLAESITMSGQLSTRWAERAINVYLNELVGSDGVDYVIACDTDSAYVDLNELVKKMCPGKSRQECIDWLNDFCKHDLGKYIEAAFEELYDTVNAFEKTMEMKREVIASDAIWTGKKHYVMTMWNKEGTPYPNGKTKITGMEAVKSSTPTAVREMMLECIPLILDGDPVKVAQYLSDAEEKFRTLPFEQMGKPCRISGLEEYEDANTVYKRLPRIPPPYSRGALVYNSMVRRLGLESKYRLISAGDHIRWCMLRTPNPSFDDVIACPDELPPEFDLDDYVDYTDQFEKIFLKPMKDLARAGGMTLNNDIDFSDLFQ